MYSGIEDTSAEYEKKVNQLSNQIYGLQTQIETLKALIEDKDYIINQLSNENSQLKSQIQTFQQQVQPINPPNQYVSPTQPPSQYASPTQPPNQYASPTQPPNQYITPSTTTNTGVITNKRVCPICGAMGFAIKEFDDKSRIISYIPRRIYAKKKVCTKCRHEF
ncbi:MAG: hypothetical protein ACFFDK_19805 [Promethearchaeota archaeon]